MSQHERLSLLEEAALLALDDLSGTFGSHAELLLKGVALAELLWKGRLNLQQGPPGGKTASHSVVVKDPAPVGNPLLDGVLEPIRTQPGKTLDHWLTADLHTPLARPIAEDLVARGILRREEGRLFWAIPVTRYPTQDPAPEAEIDSDLRRTLIGGAPPTSQDALLLSLLAATGGLGSVVTRQEMRSVKDRLQEIRESDPVVNAVTGAVQRVIGMLLERDMLAAVTVITMAG